MKEGHSFHLNLENIPAISDIEKDNDTQYGPKSTERPPKFHNTSISSNPYIISSENKSRQRLMFVGQNIDKNSEISNITYSNRNLAILNRNNRNISYLKPPNPIAGVTTKDRILDLKALDYTFTRKYGNKISSWATQNNIDDLNDIRSSRDFENNINYSKYEPEINNSVSSIVNRNEGKALATKISKNNQNSLRENGSNLNLSTPFKIEIINPKTQGLTPYASSNL